LLARQTGKSFELGDAEDAGRKREIEGEGEGEGEKK
jgi:hypothetical protein